MRSSVNLQICIAITVFAIGLVAVEMQTPDDASPISISGTVLVNGQPLSRGKIHFVAVGTPQPACDVSVVQNGQFTIRNSEILIPANYEVHVSGLNEPESISTTTMEPLPAHYNQQSVLKVAINKGGNHRLTFELQR